MMVFPLAPVRLAQLSTEIFLNGGGLLMSFSAPSPSVASAFTATHSSSTPLSKMALCVSALSKLFTDVAALSPDTLMAFTTVDWGRLVTAIVAAMRLSFPLPPDWPPHVVQSFDHVWARSQLRLGDFLSHMCLDTDLTPSAKKFDVISASRVVLGVVKTKFDKRVQQANRREEQAAAAAAAAAATSGFMSAGNGEGGGGGEGGRAGNGCPMFDGSLDQFFPLWDPSLSTTTTTAESLGGCPFAPAATAPVPTSTSAVGGSASGSGSTNSRKPAPVFHDLWATMTMSWATDEDPEH